MLQNSWFFQLPQDKNGTLEPEELFPMVGSLVGSKWITIENGPVEIVDFSIENGDFP